MERNTKTGEKRARADTGDDFTEDTQLFKTPKVVLNSCDVNFNKCDEHVGLTASKDIPRRHDSCNEPTCCKECGLHFPNLCKGSLHTVFKSLYGPIIIQSFGIYSQYRDDEHELFGPPKSINLGVQPIKYYYGVFRAKCLAHSYAGLKWNNFGRHT